MFFPIRDSIPSRIYPFVNVAIIVACSVVFVYELMLGPHLGAFFRVAAFIPARLFDSLPPWAMPQPDYGFLGNMGTILFSMFLHGGWMHIIGNMWFLYVFGDNVEDALGHLRYLFFYLGGGFAAAFLQAFLSPNATVPNIGASGAIAAVLGAYMVWFPHSRVHTLVFLFVFATIVEVPAILFLGYWFLIQFFQGTLSLGAAMAGGGVAWFAHVGGFLFGFLVALWMRRSGRIVPAISRPLVWYR
ncbi:MAG: rhomboid family intramembrane serine protease [Acidobacteria bacterium]|nr:rhomboid family intramembrane serine protease [Acidobacteriota bacterium]